LVPRRQPYHAKRNPPTASEVGGFPHNDLRRFVHSAVVDDPDDRMPYSS
jgi:hypothetical protein